MVDNCFWIDDFFFLMDFRFYYLFEIYSFRSLQKNYLECITGVDPSFEVCFLFFNSSFREILILFSSDEDLKTHGGKNI